MTPNEYKALLTKHKNAKDKVRRLQTQLETHNERKTVLSQELASAEHELEGLNHKVTNVKVEVGPPIISEHSLLRYLERVVGIDLKEVEEEILHLVNGYGKADGEVHCVADNGKRCKLILKENVVTTIVKG